VETWPATLNPTTAAIIPRPVNDAPNGDRVVVLRDDRVPVDSRDYPWSAVGRLISGNGNREIFSCTAALVEVDWVLTNAHCIVNGDTHDLRRWARFQPNLIQGQLSNQADEAVVDEAIVGTTFEAGTNPDPNDWALLHLTQPLGSRYGTLRWRVLPANQVLALAEQVKLVGYSGDFPADAPGETPGVHQGCSIVEDVDPFWVHNCDSFAGASGGPLLAKFGEEYGIVALHAGGVTDAETAEGLFNYAVKIDAIAAYQAGRPYPASAGHSTR
jgi:protease YdgD